MVKWKLILIIIFFTIQSNSHCQSTSDTSLPQTNIKVEKLYITRPSAIKQEGDNIIYSIYSNRAIKIFLKSNLLQKRNYILYNKKLFLLTYIRKDKIRIFPVLDLDVFEVFKISVNRKTYIVFVSAFAAASGKQSNYSIFVILELSNNSTPLFKVWDSYLGKISDLTLGKDGKLEFLYKSDDSSKSKIIQID